MKILVTGINGFIGRSLYERLVVEGYKVRGTLRAANQITALPSEFEAFKISSICSETNWSKALNDIYGIVHLAARTHVLHENTADLVGAFREVNVNGTSRLARQAVESGVRRFVYLSSVKVSGEGKSTPYNEEDTPTPQDAYGSSKWEAEKVLNKISKDTGMEIVILRSPLVYGPMVKANFLRLLEIVDRGIPLPLANIKNRRSFIYLDNLVDAIVTCIKHPKAAGQIYFVSDGEDVSTPQLIRLIGSAMERQVRLFPFQPVLLKMAGIIIGKSIGMDRLLRSLTINCSKIRRELDWQPPFSMDQGLRETAKWYLKRRNISRKGAKTLR